MGGHPIRIGTPFHVQRRDSVLLDLDPRPSIPRRKSCAYVPPAQIPLRSSLLNWLNVEGLSKHPLGSRLGKLTTAERLEQLKRGQSGMLNGDAGAAEPQSEARIRGE